MSQITSNHFTRKMLFFKNVNWYQMWTLSCKGEVAVATHWPADEPFFTSESIVGCCSDKWTHAAVDGGHEKIRAFLSTFQYYTLKNVLSARGNDSKNVSPFRSTVRLCLCGRRSMWWVKISCEFVRESKFSHAIWQRRVWKLLKREREIFIHVNWDTTFRCCSTINIL